jgi:ankyrin repeat protein
MNNISRNHPQNEKIFGKKIYIIRQVLCIFILFSSACAQSAADNNQSQKILSNLTNVSSDVSEKESLIDEIRKAIIEKNYIRLAELLKSKTDLNVRNKTNDSLLIEAMRIDIKSFEMLLEANADPNFGSDITGCAKSEHCLKPPTYIAFESGNLPALKLLLQYRTDPNSESILAWAVSRGDKEAVKLLLFYKANVNFNNAVGENKQSPIFFVTETEIAELLVKNGADVNQTDVNGLTPLMESVKETNLEMVRFFVKNGANVNARTKEGKTVLDLAKAIGNNEVTNELKKAGATEQKVKQITS